MTASFLRHVATRATRRPSPADALPTPQECGPATKGHYKELMTKFPLVRRFRRCIVCLCAA